MRRYWIASAVAFVVAVSLGLSAQGAPSLKGAWKVVEYTGADGQVDKAPQPGLYIFTDRHYSIQVVRAKRALLPEKPSDGELVAAWGPFTANTGTYELKGTTLMTRPIVAKMPNVMAGPGQQSELRFDGKDTVHLTSTGPNGAKTVTRLQRVE